MPKIIDHEARRTAVYEAVWRVVQRVGLEAATTREIAREANLSLGALNHYFANKEELLIRAHELAYERGRARIMGSGHGLRGVAAVRHALFGCLPLDEESVLEAHVDIAVCGYTLSNPRLAEVRRESQLQTRRLLYGCLAEARALGEIATDREDVDIIDEFFTIVDGASVSAVLYGINPEWKRRISRLGTAFIERLTTSSPTAAGGPDHGVES